MQHNNWKIVLFILMATALPASLRAQTSTWSATATGTQTWSDPLNWGGVAPANNDAIYLPGLTSTTSTVIVTLPSATTTSISGLTMGAATANSAQFTLSGSGTVLSIGSGGITNLKNGGNGGSIVLNTAVDVAVNQTWSVASNANPDGYGTVNVLGNLSGAGNITKAGVGTLLFTGGNSTGWTGNLTLDQGTVLLNNVSQYNRLGTTFYFNNTANNNLKFNGLSGGTTATFSTNVVFSDTSATEANQYNFNYSGTTLSGAGNATIVLAGSLSSATALTEQISFTSAYKNSVGGNNVIFRVTGDNSGLTSSRTMAQNKPGVFIRNGWVVLDSQNAFGANNSLYVSVGEGSSASAGMTAALLMAAGINYSGDISTAINGSGSAVTEDVYIGLENGGNSNFTGALRLGTTNTATAKTPNVHLRAGTGGAVTFSGTIFNQGPAETYKSPYVSIEGGGRVTLSGNNTYTSPTIVRSATNLHVKNTAGSATGTGAVKLEHASKLSGTGTVAGLVTTGYDFATDTTTSTGLASTIAAGDPGTVGTLNLAGGLDATQGLTLEVDINGASVDLISLGSGVLTLGGTVDFNFTNLGGGLLVGNPYQLAIGTSGTWTALSGLTFTSSVVPSGYILDTAYGTNGVLFDTANHILSVQFQNVPEPGSVMLIGFAMAMGAGMMARRNRTKSGRV